uniref:Cadherin domain-containing protein n=1 Tax=Corethron hystrix TaxID=216773 RepID=A0A7S1B9K0_9STRA
MHVSCTDGNRYSSLTPLSIAVYPINDKPNVVTALNKILIQEDSTINLAYSLGEFYITDADAHEDIYSKIHLSLSTQIGTFSFNKYDSLHGSSILLSKDGNQIELVGTIQSVNAAVKEIKMTPTKNWAGNGTLVVSCDDFVDEPSNDCFLVVNLEIEGINDEPEIVLDRTQIVIEEDHVVNFEKLFTIDDIDSHPDEIISLCLKLKGSGSFGQLTVDGNYLFDHNITWHSRSNQSQITLLGTLKSLQVCLKSIHFSPSKNWFGLQLISIELNDFQGGICKKDMPIYVKQVNDIPIILVSTTTVFVQEDFETKYIFLDPLTVTIKDEDKSDFYSENLILTVQTKNGGILSFKKNVPGCFANSISGALNHSAHLVLKGDEDALNNALGSISYTSCPDCNNPDEIVINVTDTGNLWNEITLNVKILPINDAPRIISPHITEKQETTDNGYQNYFHINGTHVFDIDADILVDNISVSIEVFPTAAGQLQFSSKIYSSDILEESSLFRRLQNKVEISAPQRYLNSVLNDFLFIMNPGYIEAIIYFQISDKHGATLLHSMQCKSSYDHYFSPMIELKYGPYSIIKDGVFSTFFFENCS